MICGKLFSVIQTAIGIITFTLAIYLVLRISLFTSELKYIKYTKTNLSLLLLKTIFGSNTLVLFCVCGFLVVLLTMFDCQ